MRIVKREETAILTATEKAILDKALEILEGIEAECEDGRGLWTYSNDAANELDSFLNGGGSEYLKVESLEEDVTEVTVTILL